MTLVYRKLTNGNHLKRKEHALFDIRSHKHGRWVGDMCYNIDTSFT